MGKQLRMKDTGLRLNVSDLKTVRSAMEIVREALGDWLEDSKTNSSDIRFAKKQLPAFALLELKIGGFSANKSGGRTVIPFPEGLTGEVA